MLSSVIFDLPMNPTPTHPFVLRAMTLRGMGSYLHGARLEFRPLTILCGKNGSGKSTWGRMINLLKESQEQDVLPFRLALDKSSSYHDETNAWAKVSPEEPDLDLKLADLGEDSAFGPFGTIGLEFNAVNDLDLALKSTNSSFTDSAKPSSTPQQILWCGKCRAGTRFRLRIAHPTRREFDFQDNHHVELRVNDLYSIRIRKRPDAENYAVACSQAFFPGASDDDDTMAHVADLRVDDKGHETIVPLADSPDEPMQKAVVEHAVNLIRKLYELVLCGCFHVGAVRKVSNLATKEDYDEMQCLIDRRAVGSGGEHTLAMEFAFASKRFVNHCAPWSGYSNQDFQQSHPNGLIGWKIWDQIENAIKSDAPSPERCIFEAGTQELRDEIQSLQLLDRSDSKLSYGVEVGEKLVKLFNEIIKSPHLYSCCPADAWPELLEEAESLIERGIASLGVQDIGRLNRLLIEAVFSDDIRSKAPAFAFETFAEFWLRELAAVVVMNAPGANGPSQVWVANWNNAESSPHGFLAAADLPRPEEWEARLSNSDGFERFSNRCFGPTDMTVHARYMSAGYHQIAPIVVQLGLMRKYELLTLENPEVHLHPSLQLEISAFLAAEARIGKFLLVETHSDLIVRRIIREILDETLPQKDVRIYFTEIVPNSGVGFDYSTLTALAIDERGRIKNWPKGFLDDDLGESQRLLDIMYGSPSSAADDEGSEP